MFSPFLWNSYTGFNVLNVCAVHFCLVLFVFEDEHSQCIGLIWLLVVYNYYQVEIAPM